LQIQRTILLPILVIVLVIAAVLGLAWARGYFLPATLGQPDFALGWSATNAWLIKGISPYDGSVIQNAGKLMNSEMAGGQTLLNDPAYINPLYSLIFFGPFGLIDYGLSRILWLTVIEICFIFFIIMSLKVAGWKVSLWQIGLVILIFLLWYNGARSVLLGQFIIIPILLMVGALWLIQHNQDVGAGFLLALSTAKPDISFLLVLYVTIWSLFTKRYRLFTSILVTTGFLFIISILLLPEWFLQWFRILVVLPADKDLYRTALSLVAQSLPGVKTPLNIVLHASAILFLLIGWVNSLKRDGKLFLWTALLTLVITTLIGYRIDAAYSLALLPALFFVFRVWQERWLSGGYLFSWISLVLILAASWGIVILSIKNNGGEPTTLFILPPLTVLLGLYWIRWWVIQSPQLPFEVLRDRYGL
jgi:hypothetical protein